MKEYLYHVFNPDDPDLISVIDELPLWAAPFGIALLNNIILKPNLTFLDVGCGLGFPLIEVSQRLGVSCRAYGIDPWRAVLKRVQLKINTYNLKNVTAIQGVAEDLPFSDKYFDLVVSNNGINNVQDIQRSINECSRVLKKGAQFIITLNLEDTMIEFYNALENVLRINDLLNEVKSMRQQIYSKRKPLDEINKNISEAGFRIINNILDSFTLKFIDANSLFNHSLIKYWFLDGWKNILNKNDLEKIFDDLEHELNIEAKNNNGIALTIPFVTIDCRKK